MTPASALTISPQRADPLTWIVAFNLPLVMAIGTGAGGVGVALVLVLAWSGVAPAAILLATGLAAAGCMLVLRAVRPHRPNFRPIQAVAPMGLGVASMFVSAAAHRGSEVILEQWTGALGLCSVMIALVPYCSARLMGALGLIGAAATAVAVQWAFPVPGAGPLSLLIAGAALPLHVGVVGAAFAGMVVASIQRWRALPYDLEESSVRPAAFSSRLRRHGTPVAIGDDVIALLEKVADGGRVSAKERMDAATLAEGIRTDLVRAVDRSWLDTIDQHHRLLVEDPDNAANRMTREQRAAIHVMIAATLESPVLDGEALRIELRSLEDGTTAVALSMNVTLPEGKRVMMLAPYFVSLKASVDDLEWAGGEQLRMRFKLPPPPEQRGR